MASPPNPRTPLPGVAKPKWELYQIEDNPEHALANSIAMEFNDVAGIKVDYYRRKASTPYDQLYGEFNAQNYEDAKTTKIVYEVGEEPNLWSNFGMVGGDVIVAHIAMGVYHRDVDQTTFPSVGDIVHMPWMEADQFHTDRVFEIAHVDHDDKVFQLKNLIWLLILKPFRYSEQSASADNITETLPLTAYGDNEFVDEESPKIFDYDAESIDKKFYGY
jgi:hypothetical protein